MVYNPDDNYDDDIEDEELEDLEEPIDIYDTMAEETEPRPINLENFRPRPLTQEEEETKTISDLQSIQKQLMPKFATKRLNDILQPFMVSRIFPENLLDLNFFTVMSLVEEYGDDVDFLGILTAVQVATAIGYEQRGRVDLLEIAGVAHDEDLAKLGKELGMM